MCYEILCECTVYNQAEKSYQRERKAGAHSVSSVSIVYLLLCDALSDN